MPKGDSKKLQLPGPPRAEGGPEEKALPLRSGGASSR